MCLSVPKDLVNLWTDLVFLYIGHGKFYNYLGESAITLPREIASRTIMNPSKINLLFLLKTNIENVWGSTSQKYI